MTRDRGALGWGIGLVALGGGLLLRDVGAWPDRLAVWPVALVAAGVGILALDRVHGRRELALPLVLIIVGGGFALRDLRLLPQVGLLPLIIIAIGVALLLSAGRPRRHADGEISALRIPLDGSESAVLRVHHGAGTLRIDASSDPTLLVDGSFTGGAEHEVRRVGLTTEVELRNPSKPWERPGRWGPWKWTVKLNADVPTKIDLRTGATKTYADLSGVRVPELSLKTGASETEILAPTRGQTRMMIEAGAASVTVRIPGGTPARIVNRSSLGSVEIDDRRFHRSGDTWASPDFDGAETWVEVELSGGLASFSVR